MKHKNVHLDGLDIKDKYSNPIIHIRKGLKHNMSIVSYAVTTVENSFTWCGHQRYTMTIENENLKTFENILETFENIYCHSLSVQYNTVQCYLSTECIQNQFFYF